MFDTEKFIAEVEKRPVIYDFNSEAYGDRSAKMNAWHQVCEVIIPKWSLLSDEEKNLKEKMLRGKWRNIRDYFNKDLKVQRSKSASSRAKMKRYMYFDQLLFLIPKEDDKEAENDSSNDNLRYNNPRDDNRKDNNPRDKNPRDDNPRTEDYPVKCEVERHARLQTDCMTEVYGIPLAHEEMSLDYPNQSCNEGEFKYVSVSDFPKSMCETTMPTSTEDFPDVLSTNSSNQKCKYDDDDYDRMFLLSLLPIMRRIPEDHKVDARIQIQQVLAAAIRSVTSRT